MGASPAPASRQRLPGAIWALGFTSLLMDVSSELIHSLLPVFLVTSLGASMLAVGFLEGIAEATALVMRVFSGVLSDAWGRRKPLAVAGYGLGALSKPLFALAPGIGAVLAARMIDRVGKGLRGAPRDALVADIAPAPLRGAAFGLRQSLDTVGAFLGPLLAIGLMLLWNGNIRAVFWVAVIPAVLSVAVLVLGVKEPASGAAERRTNPIRRENLRRLGAGFWWIVGIGSVFTLARFSEAFLVIRAQQGGLALAFAPAVLIAMNVVYSLGAYPFGRLSDRIGPRGLLVAGMAVLAGADVLLALAGSGALLWTGIALWGLHMALTQGVLAAMVAASAPADLRGSAFGFFNLASGLALLLASVGAGALWDAFGAPATFAAGAGVAIVSGLLVLVGPWGRNEPASR